MAGADAGPIVAMKIFVEKNEVAPGWLALKEIDAARSGPAAVRIAEKNAHEPPGNFCRYLPEIRFAAGMRRAFHFEIFAVVVMKLLQRFDQEIIHRKPDRPAPVRISTEKARRRLRRLVFNPAQISVDVHFVGMVRMVARQPAHAI